MEKIQRVEARYTVPPYACAITNRSDTHLLDFGVEVSGRLYMRESAFTEAALQLGFVPKDQVDKVIAEMDELKAELEKLNELFAAIEARDQAEKDIEDKAEALSA